MNQVITISREFGSGGRQLGVLLAKKLGIPFYDKDIITMAADDINMAETAFLEHEETVPDETVNAASYTPFSPIYQISMSDEIFFAQSKVVRRLADQGPCVIVGRCADMVLENSVNLFIYADMKNRIERMMTLESETEAEKMEEKVRQIDSKRKDYYQYYTGNIWGKAQNYDLCLNSGKAGLEGCLEAVCVYLNAMD